MHNDIFALLAGIVLVGGCSQAANHSTNEKNRTSNTNLLDVAKQNAVAKEGALVAFAESTVDGVPYAVSVIYSDANKRDPATCRLQILENAIGKTRVIEETNHLLFCSTVAAGEVEQKQLSVTANHGEIFIDEQRDKSNSTFEFKKSTGGWVVSRVRFNYPQQNADTADVDVVHEEGTFPGSLTRTRVSDFDASSAHLSKKFIR